MRDVFLEHPEAGKPFGNEWRHLLLQYYSKIVYMGLIDSQFIGILEWNEIFGTPTAQEQSVRSQIRELNGIGCSNKDGFGGFGVSHFCILPFPPIPSEILGSGCPPGWILLAKTVSEHGF